jgi:hypothetical protein
MRVSIAVGPVVVGVDPGLIMNFRLLDVDAPFDVGRRLRVVVPALDDALPLDHPCRGPIGRSVEIGGDGRGGEQNERDGEKS